MEELWIYAAKMLGMALPLVGFMWLSVQWLLKRLKAAEDELKAASVREIKRLEDEAQWLKDLAKGASHDGE